MSYLVSTMECEGAEYRRRRFWDAPSPVELDEVAPSQLADSELRLLGHAGFALARARQQVLQILRENSSCSAWYALAEVNPQRKFASLQYQIDAHGEDTTIADQNSFGWYYHEPYVARAQQNVGAGSIITVNAHGAFFLQRAPLKGRWSDRGPLLQQPLRYLHVASYSGGSLNAQVTTLLHEFAHVVDLLPVDTGEANSGLRSTQNTGTVLLHCRKQIEASANRVIVLPLSLAQLEQAVKR